MLSAFLPISYSRSVGLVQQFRQLLRSAQVETVRRLARSPNLNAFAERFVRTIRQECLSRMIFFGEDSSRRAVVEFVAHYNAERNHQSLEHKIIQHETTGFPSIGWIRRRKRLGGLVNYYYRKET
jgi:transposase InsO family protein